MGWRTRTAAAVALMAALSGALVGVGTRGEAATAERRDSTATAYGFTAGTQLLHLSDDNLADQLDAVVAAGGTWLRVPFNWGIIEERKGEPDWTALDRVVAAADARDLHILGVISYAPQWARTSRIPTAPPDRPADFGRFAGQVARRYAASVNTWEIWNEPNIRVGFGGRVDVEAYVALLKAAYAAIKKVQPRGSSTVVSGGLNRGPDATGGLIAYVKQMYRAGAQDFFDAVGIHPYLRAETADGYRADSEALLAEIARIRSTMLRRGDSHRIWMTEFGKATAAGFTQAQQADLLTMQLDQYAELDYAGPSILYTIRDAGHDRTAEHQNFGTLLTASGQPKVLALRLQSRASSSASR